MPAATRVKSCDHTAVLRPPRDMLLRIECRNGRGRDAGYAAPPHRSQRAGLPHSALASGSEAQACPAASAPADGAGSPATACGPYFAEQDSPWPVHFPTLSLADRPIHKRTQQGLTPRSQTEQAPCQTGLDGVVRRASLRSRAGTGERAAGQGRVGVPGAGRDPGPGDAGVPRPRDPPAAEGGAARLNTARPATIS